MIFLLMILLFLSNLSFATNPPVEISTVGTNVGIGTTSKSNSLSINSTLAIGNSSYTSTTAPTGGAIIQGNVGIGSLNPQSALDVGNGGITLGGATITSWPSGTLANPTGQVGLTAVNGSATTAIRSDGAPVLSQSIAPTWTSTHIFNGSPSILAANNVGIGTTLPSALLDVEGQVNIGGSGSSEVFTGGVMLIGNNPGLLAITGGNVGIGTTAPGTILDVGGTIRTSQLINTGLTVSTPIYSNSSNQITSGTYSGNTTKFQMASGTLTSGNLIKSDGNSNVVDAGVSFGTLINGDLCEYNTTSGTVINCTASASGSGTVTSVTLASPNSTLTLGGTNPVTTSGTINGDINLSNPNIWIGQQIFNSANVGIGSANPGQVLDVNGNIRALNSFISGSGTATLIGDVNGNVGIGSTAPGGRIDVGTGSVCINHVCNSSWPSSNQWATQNTTDVSLAGGNVGIGTTLTTASALTVMNGNVGIGTWIPIANLMVNGTSVFGSSSQTKIPPVNSVYFGGNVGIGTWTDTLPFTISGSAVHGAMQEIYTGSQSIGGGAGLNIGQDDGTVMTSGNTLGSVLFQGSSTTTHTRSTGAGITATATGAWGTNVFQSNLEFETASGSALNIRQTIDQNGNVGIGTSLPLGELDITQAGTNRFTVLSAGNVGIGSLTPGATLDVNGSIRSVKGYSAGQSACWCTAPAGVLGNCTGTISIGGACGTCNYNGSTC